jgi:hypothetical protein
MHVQKLTHLSLLRLLTHWHSAKAAHNNFGQLHVEGLTVGQIALLVEHRSLCHLKHATHLEHKHSTKLSYASKSHEPYGTDGSLLLLWVAERLASLSIAGYVGP